MVKLMFSPPFEVFCDLLMQGPMETQNIIKERCFFRLVTSVGQRKKIQLILKMLKNKLLRVAKMAGNLGQIVLA